MAATPIQLFLIPAFLVSAYLILAFLVVTVLVVTVPVVTVPVLTVVTVPIPAVFIPAVLFLERLVLALLILPTLHIIFVIFVRPRRISFARGRTRSEPLEIVTFKRIRRLLRASLRNETLSLLFDFRWSIQLREGDGPVFRGTKRRRASQCQRIWRFDARGGGYDRLLLLLLPGG